MPVWVKGGAGKLSENVITQHTIELEDRETGWLYVSEFALPEQAFLAGENETGEDMFVGRAVVEGNLVPGLLLFNSKQALFTHDGAVHTKEEKHVLCGYHLAWVPRLPDELQPHSVIGGRTKEGETLYIGRTCYQNSIVIGKIVPSCDFKLFIPHNSTEVAVDDYEILVHTVV